MTTEPAPAPAPDAPAAPPAPPPETADAITTLPPLPNPAHPRNAGAQLGLHAAEALRVMRLLNEGAASGSVDFPYPTNLEYPLPPLPAVPVPSRAGAARRVRPTPAKKVHPLVNPPLPASYPLAKPMPLADAVALHNSLAPDFPASLHYGGSSMLVHAKGHGYCWALLRTLDGAQDARDVLCLTVRFFPTQDPRPPPVHALPPQGPAHTSSEFLTGLKLSVPALLWRLQRVAGMVAHACFYCGKFLSDLDGLPMGSSGFLPSTTTTNNNNSSNSNSSIKKEEGQSQGNNGNGVNNGNHGNTSSAAAAADAPPADPEAEPEGTWVCWHPKCEQ